MVVSGVLPLSASAGTDYSDIYSGRHLSLHRNWIATAEIFIKTYSVGYIDLITRRRLRSSLLGDTPRCTASCTSATSRTGIVYSESGFGLALNRSVRNGLLVLFVSRPTLWHVRSKHEYPNALWLPCDCSSSWISFQSQHIHSQLTTYLDHFWTQFSNLSLLSFHGLK